MDLCKLFQDGVKSSVPLQDAKIFSNEVPPPMLKYPPIGKNDSLITTQNNSRISNNNKNNKRDIEDLEQEAAIDTSKKQRTIKKSVDDAEKISRTIFIGNVPKETIKKKPLVKGTQRKSGFINNELHSDRDALNAYVVFHSSEDALKAMELNGTCFEGKHLRIDSADPSLSSIKTAKKKSVFIGNLKFDSTEEQLWLFFGQCGQVSNVRIVRDQSTNVGKGFGYVEFKDRATVSLALKLDGSELNGRKLRIQRCVDPEEAKVQSKKAKVSSVGFIGSNKNKKNNTDNKNQNHKKEKDGGTSGGGSGKKVKFIDKSSRNGPYPTRPQRVKKSGSSKSKINRKITKRNGSKVPTK